MDLGLIKIAPPNFVLDGGLVLAVFALVEAVKRTDKIPGNFLPLVSIVIGTGLGLLFGVSVFEGIVIGAAASGLYDFVKKTILGNN